MHDPKKILDEAYEIPAQACENVRRITRLNIPLPPGLRQGGDLFLVLPWRSRNTVALEGRFCVTWWNILL